MSCISRTIAIISRGLYIFYPIFHCAVNIRDNLCSKQGNSSKKNAVYNQEQVKWRVYGSMKVRGVFAQKLQGEKYYDTNVFSF